VANPTASTWYVLTATDANGCTSADSVFTTTRNVPTANFDTLTLKTYCDVFGMQFNNTSQFATTFFWDFGNGTTSTDPEPTATWATLGSNVVEGFPVSLVATSPGGCADTLTIDSFVVIYDTPVAAFTATPGNQAVILIDEALVQFQELSSPAAVEFLWSFGDGSSSTQPSPTHQYTNIGDYFVSLRVANALGCADSTTYGALQVDVPLMFNIPNVLTPNGDGINDELNIQGQGVDRVEIVITDRWGSQVYSAVTNSWDGRQNNGEPAVEGAYLMRWKATFSNGRTVEETKSIMIIR
jgi:gliding motility-associated-like protein